MRRAIGSRVAHPRVMLCVPSGLTPLERDAVEQARRKPVIGTLTLSFGTEMTNLANPIGAGEGAISPCASPAPGEMSVHAMHPELTTHRRMDTRPTGERSSMR